MNPMDAVHQERPRADLPPFRAGDSVRVHVKIREGEKERIQVFEGVVIRRRGGGHSATFTVRKVSYGVGVERIFPVESPAVTKVEIKRRGHVRRARLYYLRELSGKKARLRSKVRDVSGLVAPAPEPELEAPSTADEAAALKEAKGAEAAAEEAPSEEPAEAPAEKSETEKKS